MNWTPWELLASWVAYPSVSTVMQVTWGGSPELANSLGAASSSMKAASTIEVDGLTYRTSADFFLH